MNWTQLLSTKRFGDKEVKPNSETRSRFDQDFDRLIFSHPFRKLQDKTQVFPLPEDDFVHTRLTHSLEVSSVGRSLGRAAGEFLLQKHPALSEEGFTIHDFGSIVGAACLAHDLGNPHSVIQENPLFPHSSSTIRTVSFSSNWFQKKNGKI